MVSTLLVGAAAGLAMATVHTLLAWTIVRRARGDARLSGGLFALFWGGLAAYAWAEAAWALAVEAGHTSLTLGVLVLHLKLLASSLSFFGLVAHVAFVASGRRGSLTLAALGYGALFVALEAFYAWRGALEVRAGTWGAQLVYARIDVEPWWTMLVVALFGPPLVASLVYAGLAAWARDRGQRRRILLTGAAFAFLFAPPLLAWSRGGWPYWGLVEKALAVTGALVALLARWPLKPHVQPPSAAAVAGREALLERARRLV